MLIVHCKSSLLCLFMASSDFHGLCFWKGQFVMVVVSGKVSLSWLSFLVSSVCHGCCFWLAQFVMVVVSG